MINLQENSELLKGLEQNLNIYKESIREIAEEILEGGVTKYPIFIASRTEINLGKLIIDKEELALDWSIHASTLEEFVKRKIVKEDKLPAFKKSWKNPAKFLCIFAVFDDNASFIYMPYDEE
jgi:hypothetical protein